MGLTQEGLTKQFTLKRSEMAKINGSRLGILSLFVILKSLSVVLVDALKSPMYEFGLDCFTRHEGLIKNTTIFVRYDGKPVVNSSASTLPLN